MPQSVQSAQSASSTRTRRDEVWEMKRQRFLAKRQGSGAPSGGAASDPGGRRPPPIQSGSQASYGPPSGHPNSPLSQLVANGYPPTSEPSAGFDRNVAQQWSANRQDVQHQLQQRSDPNFSGPGRAQGGQRVTQNPGGRSNLDLGWDSQPQSHVQNNHFQGNHRAAPSPHGGNSYQYQTPYGRDDPNGNRAAPSPSYQYQTPYGRDMPNGLPPSQRVPTGSGPSAPQQQYGQRQASPARHLGAAGSQPQYGQSTNPLTGQPSYGQGAMAPQRQPSPARHHGSNPLTGQPQYGQGAMPPQRQPSPARGGGMPSQMSGNYAGGAAGTRTNANGPVAQGGRQGGRPPGGASQIVFG